MTYDPTHDPEPITERTRFAVRPPAHRMPDDEGGGLVRLIDSEGWIECRVRGGRLEVRGAHVLAVTPIASNAVVIDLADDPRADDEMIPPPRG